MCFEFDYNADSEEITIIYDGSCVLRVDFDGEEPTFHNFNKVEDEDVEILLKKFCRQVYSVLSVC